MDTSVRVCFEEEKLIYSDQCFQEEKQRTKFMRRHRSLATSGGSCPGLVLEAKARLEWPGSRGREAVGMPLV